jgi:hypothetical protein
MAIRVAVDRDLDWGPFAVAKLGNGFFGHVHSGGRLAGL